MAALSGVNQTKIDAGGVANAIASGHRDGRVKVCMDTYSLASQTGATDTLKLFGTLPVGAKVLQIVLCQSGTQTSTISVGDSASATRYHAAGATDIQTAEAVMVIPGHQYVIGTTTSDNQILITFATAVGAAGTLYAEVYYTTD
jgi:hypothetical protein